MLIAHITVNLYVKATMFTGLLPWKNSGEYCSTLHIPYASTKIIPSNILTCYAETVTGIPAGTLT